MTEAPALPLRLPGATDCHLHVNDPRYAYAAGVDLTPPPATVAHYRALQSLWGIERVVVVQPSSYGTDNRCTLDAVAQFGPRARAVVVIDAHSTAQQIAQLHAQGARGVRFNLLRPSPLAAADLDTVAHRIAEWGWHLQLHAAPQVIAELGDRLSRLPVPIVFDHFGRLPPRQADTHPALRVIRARLDAGQAWVKLSGVELDGAADAPRYAPAAALARRFIDWAPERVVWGSNWPHPASPTPFSVREEADVLQWLLDCAPENRVRQQILCTNPAALYGWD